MSLLAFRPTLRLLRTEDPIRAALERGAERLLALQRTDGGWEGSWRRYAGSAFGATNTVGLTALGLVESYRVLRQARFLDGACRAAVFAMTHLGAGASGETYHPRFTGADIVLLHRLHQITGDAAYSTRAADEWRNIRGYFYFASASELHHFFQKIELRSGGWDLALYLEAADLCGDTPWADEAAGVLANTTRHSYCAPGNDYRALNTAGALRALSRQGYGGIHRAEVKTVTRTLRELVDANNVGQSVQDTAYTALALMAAGGATRGLAGRMVQWLVERQAQWGGWLQEGVQFPHVDGDALQALATYLGWRGARSERGIVSDDGAGGHESRWRVVSAHDPVSPFDGE
ncbi:MAG: hypothetical protein ACYC3S_10795 [Chloroflexota bacterium]